MRNVWLWTEAQHIHRTKMCCSFSFWLTVSHSSFPPSFPPYLLFSLPSFIPSSMSRCYLEDGASKGAWLNRSSIIFAGGDKWSVDPRVSISTLNKRDYSLQIQNVDVTDDGPYTCSVQTQHTPRTMQVHLTVQGECFLASSLGGGGGVNELEMKYWDSQRPMFQKCYLVEFLCELFNTGFELTQKRLPVFKNVLSLSCELSSRFH